MLERINTAYLRVLVRFHAWPWWAPFAAFVTASVVAFLVAPLALIVTAEFIRVYMAAPGTSFAACAVPSVLVWVGAGVIYGAWKIRR